MAKHGQPCVAMLPSHRDRGVVEVANMYIFRLPLQMPIAGVGRLCFVGRESH